MVLNKCTYFAGNMDNSDILSKKSVCSFKFYLLELVETF